MSLRPCTRLRRPSIPAIAALFAAGLLLQIAGFRHEARAAEAKGKTLVGTWELTVSLVNCDTGAALGPPFTSLHTYLPSGSFLEQGSRAGTPPTASRTVAQGVWEAIGGGRYRSRHKFFRFDSTGVFIGSNDISTERRLGTKGDFLVGAGVGKQFDANGVQNGIGCVSETGRRLELED